MDMRRMRESEHVDREHCGAWPDACRHDRPGDRFLGEATLDGKPVDVWIYEVSPWFESRRMHVHVCIRYGREDDEYISPGTPSLYLENYEGLPTYAEVTALVKRYLDRE
jgi:hypothetical protein